MLIKLLQIYLKKCLSSKKYTMAACQECLHKLEMLMDQIPMKRKVLALGMHSNRKTSWNQEIW